MVKAIVVLKLVDDSEFPSIFRFPNVFDHNQHIQHNQFAAQCVRVLGEAKGKVATDRVGDLRSNEEKLEVIEAQT